MSQGNVPGVESASLAMDTEEGVEVVWNEVLFSDKKVFKAQEVSLGCTPAVFAGGDDLQTFVINQSKLQISAPDLLCVPGEDQGDV